MEANRKNLFHSDLILTTLLFSRKNKRNILFYYKWKNPYTIKYTNISEVHQIGFAHLYQHFSKDFSFAWSSNVPCFPVSSSEIHISGAWDYVLHDRKALGNLLSLNFWNLFLTLDILKWKGKLACSQNITVLIFVPLHNKPCWCKPFNLFKSRHSHMQNKKKLFIISQGSRKEKMKNTAHYLSKEWIFDCVALLTTPQPLTVWITTNCGKVLKRQEYQTTLPASWEICMQVKK